VPILYIAFNAITLEPPSEKSKRKADRETDSRIAPSEHGGINIKLKYPLNIDPFYF
jgi:hypothetical protein